MTLPFNRRLPTVTDWWPTPRFPTARTPPVWWWTLRAGSSTGPTLGPTPSTGPTWTGGVQRKSGRYLYISWNCRCRSRFLRFFVRFQLPLWSRALPFQPNPLQLRRPAALEKPSSNLKTVNRQFHPNFLWIFLSEQPQKPMGSDMIININDGRFFMRIPNSWAVLFFPLKIVIDQASFVNWLPISLMLKIPGNIRWYPDE